MSCGEDAGPLIWPFHVNAPRSPSVLGNSLARLPGRRRSRRSQPGTAVPRIVRRPRRGPVIESAEATRCPMRAPDGTACPMASPRNEPERAPHGSTARCVIRGACDASALFTLFSNPGILTESPSSLAPVDARPPAADLRANPVGRSTTRPSTPSHLALSRRDSRAHVCPSGAVVAARRRNPRTCAEGCAGCKRRGPS